MIPPNRTEKQGEFECAAFSSAYVLRHFRIETEGFDLYDKIPDKYKMSGGSVYPKDVRYCLTTFMGLSHSIAESYAPLVNCNEKLYNL